LSGRDSGTIQWNRFHRNLLENHRCKKNYHVIAGKRNEAAQVMAPVGRFYGCFRGKMEWVQLMFAVARSSNEGLPALNERKNRKGQVILPISLAARQ
jgi:hypothetical protein